MPPTFVPPGAQTAIAGHTDGVLGPQAFGWTEVGGRPEMLQQIVVELPVAPLHTPLCWVQQPHVGQSASVVHGMSPLPMVVVVEPPVTAVVVVAPKIVVVVVGRDDVAEPQHTTRPVFRHVRRQHFFRLRLQALVARRRQKACRLAEHFASRGSAAAHAATSSRQTVLHCWQTGFGLAAAAIPTDGDASTVPTTNSPNDQHADRMLVVYMPDVLRTTGRAHISLAGTHSHLRFLILMSWSGPNWLLMKACRMVGDSGGLLRP